MKIVSKDRSRALCAVDCKSEYTHKFFTFWGKSVKAWATTYTDPGTGRKTGFWGKINVPGVRIIGGVPVYFNPIK